MMQHPKQNVSWQTLAVYQLGRIRNQSRQAAEDYWNFLQYSMPCSQQGLSNFKADMQRKYGN